MRPSEAGNPSDRGLIFGGQTRWPPALAAAMVVAILLASAGAATAVSLLLSGLLAGDGAPAGSAPQSPLLGLVWMLAFQIAAILQTFAAARMYGGEPVRTLSLGWSDGTWKSVASAAASLGLFAAVYTAAVFAFDRAAVMRDIAPAAGLARSEMWLLTLAAIGIGAPLSEELLFRGFLFPALAKSRVGLAGAAVLSTLAWTALHAGYSLYGLLEVFLVGLFFCWLTVRSRSLWVPILCHAIYNTTIVLALRWLPIPL